MKPNRSSMGPYLFLLLASSFAVSVLAQKTLERKHPYASAKSLTEPTVFAQGVISTGDFESQLGKVAAQSGVYAESPDISGWMEERARRARLGRPERVRFPLVRRSDGWGCICPEYYVGLSTANAGPQLWIEPRFARTALGFPKNTIVLAEGHFTGRRPRRDLRSRPDEPEELIYTHWEFRVTRVQLIPNNHDFYDETSPKNRAVVLSGSVGSKRKHH